MANRGVGNKYVSVNLNKSYGQQQSNNHQIQSSSSNGYGSNRNRAGGGMVVLSRPRSSQKAGPKLSVPPPLNLPSIRKEHERIDLGSNTHSAGGIAGSGTRPASSGLGWSKPAVAVAFQDKGRTGGDIASDVVDGPSKMGNGVYMPPVARSGALGTPGLGSDRGFPSVEKAAILRGEDFPSLKATLPVVSGPGQKQKERMNQKQKQLADEELSKEQGNTSRFTSTHIDMKPHTQSSHVDNGSTESASFHYGFPSSKQGRKQEEDIPALLPLVHLSPRSDWADDERDTRHGLRDRDRDHRYQKDEVVWDRDFDMPRAFSLPHKPAAHNYFDRSGHHESEAVKLSTGQVRPQSGLGEANTWRVSSPLQKEVGNNRNGIGARPSSRGREIIKANVYTSSPFRENARDCSGVRNAFYQHGGRQPWNSSADFPSNRGILTRDRHSSEQQNRDKRPYSKGENSYVEEDPFGDSDFDVRDPFPVLGVVKKKKEALRQADFHDPVRESFEAELERVQKMQEEERRRITDEQERAIEKARREEEERMRLAWEHEERQRILEEEAREAAWRAEQERLEAIRRAEELRKAKEEEKNRIFIEEERRKQAANQKLRELDERIAKRKAEEAKGNSSSSTFSEAKKLGIVEERDVSRPEDAVNWEDGERMDKHAISVPLDDPSILNRSFGMNSGLHYPKDGSSRLLDNGKPANSWRKDSLGNPNNSMFISQDVENVSRITQLDDGRVFTKNELFGAAGYGSSRTYYKAGTLEPPMDELSNLKGQRWRIPGNGDHHGRNNDMESDYQEGFGDRYGDLGWGQGQGISGRIPYDPYPENLYQNTIGDGYYPFGRTRNPVRQPRVLPPPSLASSQKPSYRTDVDRPGPSTYLENEMKHNHAGGTESTPQGGYGGDYQTGFTQHQVSRNEEQHLDRKLAPGCDSQSSLSVSSPPDSPIHLSHDDIDESGASSVLSGAGKSKECALLENHKDPGISTGGNNLTTAASEDDEEWAIDNNEQLQEQEEYEDDEDGYQEEDEIHASYEENLDLAPEFEDLHIQDKDSNMVLGFNEGVEVEMPSDDFEKCHQNGELSFTVPQHSVVSVEGQGSSVMISAKESRSQPVEAPSQPNIDSSKIFLETENVMQNLAIQSSNAPQTSVVPDILDKVNPKTDCGETTRSGIPPSLQMAPELLSVKPVTPSSSATPSHLEEPVKLQFGLFSGPSLIPSPVPAVQIGSIPLPLHPQVSSSVTHMQPTQPPVFQLGQLRYTSPIFQGVLPLTSHSLAQPSASSSILLNKDPVVHAPVQLAYGDLAINMVTSSLPLSSGPQAGHMRLVDLPNWNTLKNVDELPARENGQAVMQMRQSESAFQQEGLRKTSLIQRTEGHPQTGASAPLSVSIDTDMSLSKANSQAYRGRGKRDTFAARNLSSRNFDSSEVSHMDASGYRRTPRQRTEFRVRSSNHDASNTSRRIPANSMGNGTRSIGVPSKSAKQSIEPDSSRSGPATSQKMDSVCNFEIRAGKETVVEGQNFPKFGQTNLKRNFFSEEDIDVPLQSGIVRVFEQRGIEAPSDDDDFIEVRSKRQMLNDRREQREKEIKAKSRETKATQKPRSTVQNHVAVIRSNKSSAPGGGVNSKQSISIINKQQLAPIGTPTHKAAQADSKSQPIKSHETSVLPTVSRSLQNLPSNFIFNNENKVSDNIQSPLESWSGSQIDQPVMALTQSQLDEAMKPASIDSCAPVEDHTSEPKVASTSALAKDETVLSIANPIDSLLAAGQIQFGAVTASTILPPSSRVTSHGIGASCLSQLDLQASTDLGCTPLYPKGKHLNDASAQLKEAEAEAAASAVAVAAITSDENGGNALIGSSVSVAENRSFVGIAGEQSNQSKVEESLSVSLPADLSVDTPPISLWPPLSSPHNSNQMITHFPPGPPHFPFYEMNPMLRAPIFAFGPRDEAGSNQSQPQMGTGTISAPPPGTWQQCPPGIESCYRPTGFTGPFISQPGGMSGVQGSPHMVVYNHFGPVGQFGQVGLSFMGYIPSGKQPDWKHNPVSSPMIGGDCDANNSTVGSTQRNPTIMPASVQHLAPGSALLPMPMYDVSPFQSSADIPVQARWPHIVPTPLQLAPSSMPLQQQQTEGALSFNIMPSIDQSSTPNRFPDVRTSTSSDTTRTFSAVKDLPGNRFPDELGVGDTSVQRSVVTNTASSSVTETNRTQNTNSGFKPPPSQQKNVTSTGFYNHQRGSQRNNEWHPHHPRRSGFQGRNQQMGGEKSFPTTKVKQIYVAKQTSSSSTSIPATTLPRCEQ